MKQSKVEFIGKFIHTRTKTRFRIDSVMIDDEDKTTIQHPESLDMTQTSFVNTMKQVYQRLQLYKRAKLTITINEANE